MTLQQHWILTSLSCVQYTCVNCCTPNAVNRKKKTMWTLMVSNCGLPSVRVNLSVLSNRKQTIPVPVPVPVMEGNAQFITCLRRLDNVHSRTPSSVRYTMICIMQWEWNCAQLCFTCYSSGSMEQSPSKADSHSAIQKTPHLMSSQAPIPACSVHSHTSFKIAFNIISSPLSTASSFLAKITHFSKFLTDAKLPTHPTRILLHKSFKTPYGILFLCGIQGDKLQKSIHFVHCPHECWNLSETE